MKIRKAIFPAAGLGTRFLPATKASPKEMLPLVDKPLIQYSVEEAIASGIDQILIVTGRGKDAIENHFDISFELEFFLKNKKQHKLLHEVQKISQMADFHYIRQKEPLGLGHAILRAKEWIGNEPFAVILSDDVVYSKTPALKQLIDIHQQEKSSVIAVEPVATEDLSKYGIIAYKKSQERTYRISDLVEKPAPELAPSHLGIIGRYILTPGIFEMLEKTLPDHNGEIQLTNGLKMLLKKEKIFGQLLEGKRYDAGSKLGFLKATVEFALLNRELGLDFRNYLKDMTL